MAVPAGGGVKTAVVEGGGAGEESRGLACCVVFVGVWWSYVRDGSGLFFLFIYIFFVGLCEGAQTNVDVTPVRGLHPFSKLKQIHTM